MGLNELKSQKRAVELIKAATTTKRIAHTYLFYGQSGVGKRKAALIFAQLLNCDNPLDGEPCEVCSNCRKVKTGNHPDVLMIIPEGASIKIAQIRSMQEKANYKCYEGRFKVIMIDDAHLMTTEAANSLLKILEEPPEQTVFILLAEDTAKLPDTILSRCQAVSFGPLDDHVLREILLRQGINTDIPLSMARGSASKALEIIEKANYHQLNDNVKKLLMDLHNGGYYEIYLWAETFEKDRDSIENVLDLLAVHYRDSLIYQAVGDTHFYPKATVPEIGNYSIKDSYAALEEINKAVYNIKNNANNRLVMENLFIRLRNIAQRKGV